MNAPATLDATQFRRILKRNVTLPLVVGIASVVAFVGFIAYFLSVMSWVEHTQRVIGKTNELVALSSDMEAGMRGYALTGNAAFLDRYTAARPLIFPEIDALAALVADNPTQVDRLRRVKSLEQQWDAYSRRVIELRRSGGDAANEVSLLAGKQLSDRIAQEFSAARSAEQDLLKERIDASHVTTWTGIVLYVVFIFVVNAIVAFNGRRDIVRLSTDFRGALQAETDASRDLQEQAWLREGQSRLAQQLIGQQSLAVLSRNVLAFCADALQLAVGAMYVRDAAGKLQRTATHGFEPGSANAEAVDDAEAGLVGQTASDGRLRHLRHIDTTYLKVVSGLGETKPAEVLLVPTTNDGALNGVVELAFLHPVSEREVELLRRIGAGIGASIDAALYRKRLQDAVEGMQQLNEELQVQQEELRTANEELGEQSRVLAESQTHLQHQQAELEQTNQQLVEQADILDRKNEALNDAQRALQERADELQRASRYKSEFLANMSHELRTPLNSSLILAKLLSENRDGNLTPEQLKFAQTIYSAGNDLLNLINDILDLSKVESGRLELQPQFVSVRKLADGLQAVFTPLAQQKKLEFRLDVDPDAPASLVTDLLRAEQVLKNLLSNAIKFTETGRVSLRIDPLPGQRISFAVRDSGIGIAPSQQEVIFEAFRQADGTINRRYGGTGLGLSISRELTRLLGGTLEVESAPGQGSTFTLTLPVKWTAARADEDTAPAAASASASPRVAEAAEAARRAAAAAASRKAGRAGGGDASFAGTGHRTITSRGVGSGADADADADADAGTGGSGRDSGGHPAGASDDIDANPNLGRTGRPMSTTSPPAPGAVDDDRAQIERPGSAGGPRVLLVVEDDATFASVLRDLAREMRYHCLVATTAHEALELALAYLPSAILLDIRLPDDSGLSVLQFLKGDARTRHIPVHIVAGEDVSEVALHMGAVGFAVKPTTREQLRDIFARLEEKAARKVKRVLVVEDDARQRDSVVHLIEDDDVEIAAVENGGDALELLKTTVYDCMIIDLKLPDMEGSELLERMTSEDICSFPPVIVYTGRNLTREEEAKLNRYSRSIIIKGARSPERLLDEVTLFLHKVESQLSVERQVMLRAARNREKVFEGRKVLLVDDDVRNIFALASALEHKGLAVEIGRNGFEALSRLAEVPDIDLVLMDVMMPGMDGLEATRRIRANPKFAQLPVIAITAKAMKDDQEQCRRAGANDYLAKPIDLDRLFSLLRVWMPAIERL